MAENRHSHAGGPGSRKGLVSIPGAESWKKRVCPILIRRRGEGFKGGRGVRFPGSVNLVNVEKEVSHLRKLELQRKTSPQGTASGWKADTVVVSCEKARDPSFGELVSAITTGGDRLAIRTRELPAGGA